MTKIAKIFMFLFFTLSFPLLAEDAQEISQTPPVAIVALAQGPVQVQRPGRNWETAYWLSLVQPEDKVRTGQSGKLVLTYFHDYHREVLEPETEAKIGFRSLSQISESGNINKDSAKDRGVTEIPIPYLLVRQLYTKEFEDGRVEGALERESTFLSSHVKAEAFPPVFVWSDTGASSYKLQLFNEWDEFLYETETTETRFKYPYRSDFNLAKNSLYKWQVVDDQDKIIVRRYPFILLTTLHANQLEAAEKSYQRLEKNAKVTPADQTDLFLLYVQRKMIDKYLHLLQKMAQQDPTNPLIQRGLVRAYLSKGAPAHAWQALELERSHGGVDDLRD